MQDTRTCGLHIFYYNHALFLNYVETKGIAHLTKLSGWTKVFKAGRNYFDVVLTINGRKTKVIKGTAIVEESASV